MTQDAAPIRVRHFLRRVGAYKLSKSLLVDSRAEHVWSGMVCQPSRAGGTANVKNLRKISVGNGLCAVPQYRVPCFPTGLANTEIVDFGPRGPKSTGRHVGRPLQVILKFLTLRHRPRRPGSMTKRLHKKNQPPSTTVIARSEATWQSPVTALVSVHGSGRFPRPSASE